MKESPGEPRDSSRADREYWDRVWQGRRCRKGAILDERWERNFVILRIGRFLARRRFLQTGQRGTLLEIGCARSLWLPYFAQRWGFRVEGIDYSDEGCRQAEEILARYGVAGNIHRSDFFSRPENLGGKFDVVISNGVVEHFEDRAGCLAALKFFLKPSGLLITLIPNLCGLMGTVTRVISPEIYRRHVPTSREDLAAAHASASLKVLHCDYFLPVHLGVINVEFVRPALLRSALSYGASSLSGAFCALLDSVGLNLSSRALSPYVLSVAENVPAPPRPDPASRPATLS